MESYFKINDYAANNFPLMGIKLLDIAPMLDLRPDGKDIAHTILKPGIYDCLHFCLPGPVDIFSRIIGHKLFMGEL